MTVISPAIGVQSGSHSALAFRQLASALAGADVTTFVGGTSALDVGHGLVRTGMLAVTQNGTPNMSVNVSKGTAFVNGSSVLAQGIYAVTNDATVNLAIATADATNPRRDLVCIQVRDNTADASGFNDARLFVITGTPAASPVDPAVPAGCLVLARVAVAALASSIVNANITALAGLARGSNWNQAWGTVGYAAVSSDQTGITSTITDITGLTTTVPVITGRRYRTTLHLVALSVTAGGLRRFYININGTDRAIAYRNFGATGQFEAIALVSYIAGLTTGNITFKARASSDANTVTISSGGSVPGSEGAFILVEDIGPA